MIGGQFLPPASAGGLAAAPSAFSTHHLSEEDEDDLSDTDAEDHAPLFAYEIDNSCVPVTAADANANANVNVGEGLGSGEERGKTSANVSVRSGEVRVEKTACKLYREDAEWEDGGALLDDEPLGWVEESEDEDGGGVLLAAAEKMPVLGGTTATEEARKKGSAIQNAGRCEKEGEKDRRYTSPVAFPAYGKLTVGFSLKSDLSLIMAECLSDP